MEKVYIKDKQDNKVLPITHVSAVLDDEGNDLGSHLGNFEDEVRGLVDTPHQEYVTVEAYNDLPGTGSKDTIYRVSNYNGSTSQVDATKYSEYAWDGTQYVFLCVKSQIGEVFDITVYNNNTKYADLAAALSGTNVPDGVRKGGMSVKFVQSSDNKYVQCRFMLSTFTAAQFANTANWQGIDKEPTAGSQDVLTSGGAYSNLLNKQFAIGLFYFKTFHIEGIEYNDNYIVVPSSGNTALTFKIYKNYSTSSSNLIGTASFVGTKDGNTFTLTTTKNTISEYGDSGVSGFIELTTNVITADGAVHRITNLAFMNIFKDVKDLQEGSALVNEDINNLKDDVIIEQPFADSLTVAITGTNPTNINLSADIKYHIEGICPTSDLVTAEHCGFWIKTANNQYINIYSCNATDFNTGVSFDITPEVSGNLQVRYEASENNGKVCNISGICYMPVKRQVSENKSDIDVLSEKLDDTIYAIGDSLTQAGKYEEELSKLLGGIEVKNYGIGGEGVGTIFGRVNTILMKVSTDFTIPTTTTDVQITLIDDFSSWLLPLLQDGNTANVVIGGVEGVLSTEAAASAGSAIYYFKRDEAGEQIAIHAGEPIYFATAAKYGCIPANKYQIIWVGQNGGFNNNGDTGRYDPNIVGGITQGDCDKLVEMIREHISCSSPRKYLVLSPTQNTNDMLENTLSKAFGGSFVNVRKQMMYNGIRVALEKGYLSGSYPTSQDTEDINNGKIPESLRRTSTDYVHFNTAGYKTIAAILKNIITYVW